jgi:hypothetical protein
MEDDEVTLHDDVLDLDGQVEKRGPGGGDQAAEPVLGAGDAGHRDVVIDVVVGDQLVVHGQVTAAERSTRISGLKPASNVKVILPPALASPDTWVVHHDARPPMLVRASLTAPGGAAISTR